MSPSSKTFKGRHGGAPLKRFVTSLARLRTCVSIDEFYTTKRCFVCKCTNVYMPWRHRLKSHRDFSSQCYSENPQGSVVVRCSRSRSRLIHKEVHGSMQCSICGVSYLSFHISSSLVKTIHTINIAFRSPALETGKALQTFCTFWCVVSCTERRDHSTCVVLLLLARTHTFVVEHREVSKQDQPCRLLLLSRSNTFFVFQVLAAIGLSLGFIRSAWCAGVPLPLFSQLIQCPLNPKFEGTWCAASARDQSSNLTMSDDPRFAMWCV